MEIFSLGGTCDSQYVQSEAFVSNRPQTTNTFLKNNILQRRQRFSLYLTSFKLRFLAG